MRVRLLAGLTVLAVAGAAEQNPAADLTGLRAERRFAPDVNGPLVIRGARDGASRAEIGGYRVPVVVAKNAEFRGEIPGDRGSFRGALSADRETISGHWVQPWNYRSFSRLAPPVALARRPDGVWTGVVTPLENRLRFFPVVERSADGNVTGFPRNPEANLDRCYPIDRIVANGQAVPVLDAQGKLRFGGRYDGRCSSTRSATVKSRPITRAATAVST